MHPSISAGLKWILSICLVLTVVRQVFDFLGHMWLPILANFLHIIFLILGLFGIVQFRPSFLIAFSTWTVVWIGWNSFLITFYLNVGILNRDMSSDVLGFGTGGSKSFWIEHT